MPIDSDRKPGRRVPIRVLEWMLDRAIKRQDDTEIKRLGDALDLAYRDHIKYLERFRDALSLELEIQRFEHRKYWASLRTSPRHEPRYERPVFEEQVSG
jgi:hypothetical protein